MYNITLDDNDKDARQDNEADGWRWEGHRRVKLA